MINHTRSSHNDGNIAGTMVGIKAMGGSHHWTLVDVVGSDQ